MNLYAEFVRLQVHKLNCQASGIKSGQQSIEYEAACNSLRNESAASDKRMRDWHIAFAQNPEEFLCVTESDMIAGRKALAFKKSSQNHGAPICGLRHFSRTLLCPSKEFTQLFSALLDGLIFIVQHRRPIDIESSPIQARTLNDLILATIQLRESHPETVQNWMERTTLLVAEFNRFGRYQTHHRSKNIGSIISVELKTALLEFLSEIIDEEQQQVDEANHETATPTRPTEQVHLTVRGTQVLESELTKDERPTREWLILLGYANEDELPIAKSSFHNRITGKASNPLDAVYVEPQKYRIRRCQLPTKVMNEGARNAIIEVSPKSKRGKNRTPKR